MEKKSISKVSNKRTMHAAVLCQQICKLYVDFVQHVIVSPVLYNSWSFQEWHLKFVRVYCIILWHYHDSPCSATVWFLYTHVSI